MLKSLVKVLRFARIPKSVIRTVDNFNTKSCVDISF